MKKILPFFFSVLFTFSSNAQSYIDYITNIKFVDKKDFQQSICVSNDKKYLAIATQSAIKIVDIPNLKIVKQIPIEFKKVCLATFLESNDQVLITGEGKEGASAEIYYWPEKKLIKRINPLGEGDATMFFFAKKSKNYLICGNNKRHILYILNPNTLELIKTIPHEGKMLADITISPDETLISYYKLSLFGDQELWISDFNGKIKYNQAFPGAALILGFTSKNDLIVSSFSSIGETSSTVYKISNNFKSAVTLATQNGMSGRMVVSNADKFIAYQDVDLYMYFVEDKEFVKICSGFVYNLGFKDTNIWPQSIELSSDIYLISKFYENFNSIVDIKKKEFIGYLYTFGNSIAFISPDGRFTGDEVAISNLKYKIPHIPDINLSSQVSQFYTPKLFNQVVNSTGTTEDLIADFSKVVKLSPEIRITSPDSISVQKNNSVTVLYNLKDNGDKVKDVRFYINGKLLSANTRGFKVIGDNSQEIPLLTGDNVIEVVAVSNSGYQSSPDRIVVKLKGTETTANLYILGIGINQYKNSKYNLNYAVADISSVVDYIKANGIGIFKNIDAKYLIDLQATKSNIVEELNRISVQSNESDVFVLYYAGHGVMSEGSSDVAKDYYMVLSDVYQMFGNDNLLAEKGLSAGELREFCKKIKAQKQVILLDACQSGGATETFAMRGASEEKAIIQLAQSTGVFLISSTGAEQFATEFAELKHGVFTYALLDGLKGAADGGNKDGKITIKELESYLNDRIPELTQKYRGSMQFPNTWSRGMDFPIVISK